MTTATQTFKILAADKLARKLRGCCRDIIKCEVRKVGHWAGRIGHAAVLRVDTEAHGGAAVRLQ